MTDCCGELLYPEEMSKGCEILACELLSILDGHLVKHFIWNDTFFKNTVAICVELILAVRIAAVNFENRTVVITTC